MSELVSCIIAVRNGEQYLAEAIDSIRAQTYTDTELIVIDDGSTDGSAKVAAAYEGARVVSQPPSGHAAARNRGVREARGTLLAFLDADDLWRPDKLAHQVARFEDRPELDVSVTHLHMFWAPHLAAEEASYRARADVDVPGFIFSTTMVRRATFDRFGMLDESLRHAPITEWFARVKDGGGEVEVLPDILVDRRMHETNISRLNMATSHDEHLRLVKARLDRRRGRPADGQ